MKKFYEKGRFVIRVYGILINSLNEVLLSDEYRYKMKMTKFPGGGLQYGEGPEDCLLREAIEEFGQPAEIESHFYTTGFYQKALFYDDHQLISIYYKIKIPQKIKFKISRVPFDFPILTEGAQAFRWQKLDSLKEGDLSFPVDKYVSEMLTRQFRNSQET